MSAKTKHDWFDSEALERALSRKDEPETSLVRDILAKSLALEPLGLDEAVTLMRARKQQDIALVLGTADLVKQKVYGDRIVITAPLHISNHCMNECLYCSARAGNGKVCRKRLDPDELRQAGLNLARQGHKRIMLTSGQGSRKEIEYYAEAMHALRAIFEGPSEIRRVNLNLGDLAEDEYELLKGTDAGTINIFQETYHRPSYEKAHAAGPKKDYDARLESPGKALACGMEDVGIGLSLGLGPRDYDILGACVHASHLAKEYGTAPRTINIHRVRPAPGCDWRAPHALNDSEFLLAVAIMRLCLPYIGIILTTREPAGIWRDACNAGASQLLTGSLANPYESWVDAPGEKTPFPMAEDTHLDEVVRFLLGEAKHLPSFCVACPRLGRSGREFITMVSHGDIKSQCGPNSMASFLEFLMHYATPFTRQLGEKTIREKLAQMNEHDRRAAEKLLIKVRSGRMDEFI